MPSERIPSGSGNSLEGQNQDVNNAQDIVAASGVEAGATSTPDSSVTTPAGISSSPRNAETADPADMVYGYGSPSEPSVDNVPAIPLEDNETSTVDDTAEVQHTPDVDSDYERKKEEAIRRLPTVDRFVYDMVRYVELSREDIKGKGPYNDLVSSSIDALRKAIEIAKGNPVSLKDDVHNNFLVRAVMNSQIVESLLKDVASEERLSDQKRAENQFKIDVLEGLLEKVDNGYHSRQPVGIDIPKKGPQGGASAESANELLGKLRESVQNPEGRVDSSSSTNANLPPSIPTSRRVDSSSSTSRGESFSGDNSVDLSSVPPEVRSQIDKIDQLIKDPRLSGVEKLDLMHEKQKILSGYSHESKLQSGVDTGARGSTPSGESYSSSPEDDFHTNLMGAILGNLHRGMSRNRQDANANANANAKTTSENGNENENKEKGPEQEQEDYNAALADYARLRSEEETRGSFAQEKIRLLKGLIGRIFGRKNGTESRHSKREREIIEAENRLKKSALKIAKRQAEAAEAVLPSEDVDQMRADLMVGALHKLLDVDVRQAINNEIAQQQEKRGFMDKKFLVPMGRWLSKGGKWTRRAKNFGVGITAGVFAPIALPAGIVTGVAAAATSAAVHRGSRLAAIDENLKRHQDAQGNAIAQLSGEEVMRKYDSYRNQSTPDAAIGDGIADLASWMLEAQRGMSHDDAKRSMKEARKNVAMIGLGFGLGKLASLGANMLLDSTDTSVTLKGTKPGNVEVHDIPKGAEEPTESLVDRIHDAANVSKPDGDTLWDIVANEIGSDKASGAIYKVTDALEQAGHTIEWINKGTDHAQVFIDGRDDVSYLYSMYNVGKSLLGQ